MERATQKKSVTLTMERVTPDTETETEEAERGAEAEAYA